MRCRAVFLEETQSTTCKAVFYKPLCAPLLRCANVLALFLSTFLMLRCAVSCAELLRGLGLWGSVGLSLGAMQPLLSAGACAATELWRLETRFPNLRMWSCVPLPTLHLKLSRLYPSEIFQLGFQ